MEITYNDVPTVLGILLKKNDKLEQLVLSLIDKQKNQEVLDENLTIQEAAAFLNLAVPTIYSMVSRQEIPFSKPGRSKRLYFSKQELTDWIKSGRRKTHAEFEAEASNYIASKTHKKG